MLNYLASFLYIASILTLYPSLLGAKFSILGLAILIVLTPITLLRFRTGNYKLGMALFAWFFVFLVSSVLIPGGNGNSVLIFSSVFFLFSINSFLLLSNQEELRKIHDLFLVILCLQAFSCIFTFSLVLSGFDIESLLLIDFMPNEKVPGNIYFPLSFGGTYFTTSDFRFIRFSSFFREPGVSQILYVYFICYSLFFVKRKLLCITILLLGLVASLSTTFLVTLPLAFVLYYLFSIKKVSYKVLVLILSPLMLIILYKAPFFGLENKLVTHTATVTERLEPFFYLTNTLNETWFFGEGMFSPGQIKNSSVNFILSLRENGLFGLVLFSVFYVYPLVVFDKRARQIFLALTSSFLVTALFVQPVFYSVINIFIFSCSFLLSMNDNKSFRSNL